MPYVTEKNVLAKGKNIIARSRNSLRKFRESMEFLIIVLRIHSRSMAQQLGDTLQKFVCGGHARLMSVPVTLRYIHATTF